jgi:hypothetical protein
VIARILALVLALLLVGGAAAAWTPPASGDAIADVTPADDAALPAPALDAPAPRTITTVAAPAPSLGAGRAHPSSVFRPPRHATAR